MPSKKNIIHRLGEIEKNLTLLKADVEEHYKEESKLEKVMRESGFLRTERDNCGVIYIEFHKDGLTIDMEDINQE